MMEKDLNEFVVGDYIRNKISDELYLVDRVHDTSADFTFSNIRITVSFYKEGDTERRYKTIFEFNFCDYEKVNIILLFAVGDYVISRFSRFHTFQIIQYSTDGNNERFFLSCNGRELISVSLAKLKMDYQIVPIIETKYHIVPVIKTKKVENTMEAKNPFKVGQKIRHIHGDLIYTVIGWDENYGLDVTYGLHKYSVIHPVFINNYIVVAEDVKFKVGDMIVHPEKSEYFTPYTIEAFAVEHVWVSFKLIGNDDKHHYSLRKVDLNEYSIYKPPFVPRSFTRWYAVYEHKGEMYMSASFHTLEDVTSYMEEYHENEIAVIEYCKLEWTEKEPK